MGRGSDEMMDACLLNDVTESVLSKCLLSTRVVNTVVVFFPHMTGPLLAVPNLAAQGLEYSLPISTLSRLHSLAGVLAQGLPTTLGLWEANSTDSDTGERFVFILSKHSEYSQLEECCSGCLVVN